MLKRNVGEGSMVNGLDLFKEKFQSFEDCYTVIGGTACSVLMENATLEFRATQDIDMILLVDSPRFNEFAEQLLEFIDDGDCYCEERANGTKRLYRFKEPKTKGFPTMIELFSRNALNMKGKRRITYVKTDKDPSGLSAMLLSDSYYNFAMQGREKINGIWTLQAPYLIPLKMYTWINLDAEKRKGRTVEEYDLNKHKYDVFRLLPLVRDGETVSCNEKIQKDVSKFIGAMVDESLSAEGVFGDWALEEMRTNFDKDRDLDRLRKIYLK